MISIWEEELDERQPNRLKKDRSCQVLVIGASLTGLFTAFFLQKKGLEVIVVEEETLEQRALEVDFFEKIEDLRTWAYSVRYAYLCIKNQMKCDFIRMPAYYYWMAQKPTAHMPKQPVFHPVKWFREMESLLEIYEQVTIREIKKNRLVTASEYIDFESVVDVRKKPSKEVENWIAIDHVKLKQGVYLCMDGDAHFLTWGKKLLMRSSYLFLFPGAKAENQWEVNCGKKEGIYESMRRADEFVKKFAMKTQNYEKINTK